MKHMLSYYLLTLGFYLIEVFVFSMAYDGWEFDVFWLNMAIRVVLASFFAIIVRSVIFSETRHFYLKFFVLILFSPLLSSLLLKLLTTIYPLIGVIYFKILSDLITSFLVFLSLKKIA